MPWACYRVGKYALGLELEDPGFDFSVLSEFRSRLLEGGAEGLLLEKLLEECKRRGLLKARGKQRTDSTHVLAAVKAMGRLECIGETLRAALNALATAAPEWLGGWAPPEWYERYGPRVEKYRLPRDDAERKELAERIGADGFRFLAELEAESAPTNLRGLEAVGTLRRVWSGQYHRPAEDGGVVKLRDKKEIPPAAEMVQSPYDTEARYSWKWEVNWVGYKAHLTETCDKDGPNLITHVETTPSTSPTCGRWPRCTRPSPGRTSCPRGISWTPDTWGRRRWRTPGASTASTCSGRCGATAAGRRRSREASTRPAFGSTGRRGRRRARRERRAATGSPSSTATAGTWWRSCSPRRSAGLARAAPCAPALGSPAGSSPCAPDPSTRSCWKPANANPPKGSGKSTGPAPGWKGPFRRGYEALV
ncbi:MAG: hypothetical protein M3R38_10955 [Actinomycetota bacterium]|nr:hypothetical protein [Actinomycetota bacterium]